MVVNILQKIAPDSGPKMEDVVHRMGKKEDRRMRQIVIMFAHRRVKEEVWKKSKDSGTCRDEGIGFAEMLPKEDLEEWPMFMALDRAGSAGRRSLQAYIDGRGAEEKEHCVDYVRDFTGGLRVSGLGAGSVFYSSC